MRIKEKFGLGVAVLLASLSATVNADVGGYAGVEVGTPVNVFTSSSGLAFKIFGGAKIHEFHISDKMGSIQLAIQGEYVNFGKFTNSWWGFGSDTGTASGIGVDAVGSWMTPVFGGDKLGVIVKVGGAQVKEKWNTGGSLYPLGASFTYTGVSKGVAVEYRIIPALAVTAGSDWYPGGYGLLGISGVFHF